MKFMLGSKKFFLSLVLFISCASLAGQSLAVEDPINMLKDVTNKVMTELKNNREALRQNPGKIYGIVNHLIIPHADFSEMGKWIVGRNAWGAATPAIQESFVNEIKTLVVRTYASSLLAYTDQTLEFLPLRESYEGKERVQVTSMIKSEGKKSFRLDYRLIKDKDSWKVYDIVIEGVSLMQGYRAQFADLAKTGGLTSVVAKLKQHNSGKK